MSRLRRKKVDANNGSFSLDENDDTQDVTSVTDECDVAQAHKNFIEEISNATFVLDDGEQEQAHLSLNMSLEMEEVGGNGNDIEFENNPEEEEEEASIPNAKKRRGQNKTYILIPTVRYK